MRVFIYIPEICVKKKPINAKEATFFGSLWVSRRGFEPLLSE